DRVDRNYVILAGRNRDFSEGAAGIERFRKKSRGGQTTHRTDSRSAGCIAEHRRTDLRVRERRQSRDRRADHYTRPRETAAHHLGPPTVGVPGVMVMPVTVFCDDDPPPPRAASTPP